MSGPVKGVRGRAAGANATRATDADVGRRARAVRAVASEPAPNCGRGKRSRAGKRRRADERGGTRERGRRAARPNGALLSPRRANCVKGGYRGCGCGCGCGYRLCAYKLVAGGRRARTLRRPSRPYDQVPRATRPLRDSFAFSYFYFSRRFCAS